MDATCTAPAPPAQPAAPAAPDRDAFLLTLVRELTGTLQDVVGLDEVSGFLGVVGQQVGEEMSRRYQASLALPRLTRDQVARVLVEMKRRIGGGFRVVAENDDCIVLANRICPFGPRVEGRPSLCMLTSSIFGSITAHNLGYAKVHVDKAIAQGDPACRVVIYLRPTPEADAAPGREYFHD